jgi:hypothetical protein
MTRGLEALVSSTVLRSQLLVLQLAQLHTARKGLARLVYADNAALICCMQAAAQWLVMASPLSLNIMHGVT